MLTTLVISCCLVFIFLQLTNPYISLAKNAIKHTTTETYLISYRLANIHNIIKTISLAAYANAKYGLLLKVRYTARTMFREMRRFKQLLPQETAIEILNRNTSGTLALIGDNDYPYAVPISYVYIDGKLYFHSAKSGHKIDAIIKHEKASFCVIDQDHIVPEKYTTYFRSVIAFGKVHLVEDMNEMRRIATLLFMKYSADYKDGIPKEIDSSIRNMAIIEMTIEHLTGKEAIELVKMKKVDKE